jgi:hypothetical protein
MNDRIPNQKPSDLPPEVQAELLRRRDAVDAGEPTLSTEQVFAELQRRSRERNSPKPA